MTCLRLTCVEYPSMACIKKVHFLLDLSRAVNPAPAKGATLRFDSDASLWKLMVDDDDGHVTRCDPPNLVS